MIQCYFQPRKNMIPERQQIPSEIITWITRLQLEDQNFKFIMNVPFTEDVGEVNLIYDKNEDVWIISYPYFFSDDLSLVAHKLGYVYYYKKFHLLEQYKNTSFRFGKEFMSLYSFLIDSFIHSYFTTIDPTFVFVLMNIQIDNFNSWKNIPYKFDTWKKNLETLIPFYIMKYLEYFNIWTPEMKHTWKRHILSELFGRQKEIIEKAKGQNITITRSHLMRLHKQLRKFSEIIPLQSFQDFISYFIDIYSIFPLWEKSELSHIIYNIFQLC